MGLQRLLSLRMVHLTAHGHRGAGLGPQHRDPHLFHVHLHKQRRHDSLSNAYEARCTRLGRHPQFILPGAWSKTDLFHFQQARSNGPRMHCAIGNTRHLYLFQEGRTLSVDCLLEHGGVMYKAAGTHSSVFEMDAMDHTLPLSSVRHVNTSSLELCQ